MGGPSPEPPIFCKRHTQNPIIIYFGHMIRNFRKEWATSTQSRPLRIGGHPVQVVKMVIGMVSNIFKKKAAPKSRPVKGGLE